MKISVFGSGYVGLVTATCFAHMGNHVVCVDINAERVAMLNAGGCPLYEPGLEAMLVDNVQAGRIVFTTDACRAIGHGEVIFIAVGTPPREDGSADLQYVDQVAQTIGEHINEYTVVVDKSTVPVGTADRVGEHIQQALDQRKKNVDFDVVSNPEFLKEGSAVADCMRPDRIIIGSRSERAIELVGVLYAPFNRNHDKLMVMDERSAELTKYAANAMLATKISFMNEMSRIAEQVGADIEHVRRGIGSDPRIGYAFIYPGPGYGGSCFPKDVQALRHTAQEHHYDAKMLSTVHQVNELQKRVLFEKLQQHFGDLQGRTIAIWGLAFKPNTDDIRDASSLVTMQALWQAGATVQAYDPQAMDSVRRHYGERADLKLCDAMEAALEGADALVVMTEWTAFRSPDFDLIEQQLSSPVIFDGRNLYDPSYLKRRGFTYYGIGRC